MTAFAADELVLLARLSGTPLPSSVDGGWLDGDELVADVVAARSLLARGMLSQSSDGLRITAAMDRILAPLRSCTVVVEVDGAGGRGVVVPGLQMREREPDVWELSAACDLLDDLADDVVVNVARDAELLVMSVAEARELLQP